MQNPYALRILSSMLVAAALSWSGIGCHSVSPGRADSRQRFDNPDGRPPRSFRAEGKRAMAASASGEASRIAADVMRTGGNAVDAAVAASFAVSVIRPQSTGIGGGGFLIVYDAGTKRSTVYDFRETAPAKAHRDMYVEDGAVVPGRSLVGHLAVGVPGLVAGLARVHADHGSRPWSDLLEPAIQLAEQGFPVYPELARRLDTRKESLGRFPSSRAVFFRGGEPLKEGALLVQADLAGTLRAIAARGADGFYRGETAEAIAADMRTHGGLITRDDLANYTVKTRLPVIGTFRGYDIVSMPPPSSGGTHIVQMLNVLDGYPLHSMGWKRAPTAHAMIEAMRQAYADRAEFMGDPDFLDVPVERLTSAAYAERTRALISPDRARNSSSVKAGGGAPRESGSTTHLSIIDPDGNVVASTQTINYSFGSCLVAPGTGVLLNNEMDDFSAQPGVPNVYGLVGGDANAVAPGKRPLSSMSPTIVLKDGEPRLVLGSPGGSRIITSVLQVVLNVIVFELDLWEAVAQGRLHHQWLPDEVVVERGGYPDETIDALRDMGHFMRIVDGPIGEIQAIQIRDDGTRVGVSDPRRSGAPAGF